MLGLGFWTTSKQLNDITNKRDFAFDYRNRFVEFSNQFHSTFDRHWSQGSFDNEKYIWLTKNVSKMQNYLGAGGKMEYIGPFQSIHIRNYEIVINTLPKFRDGSILSFDVNSVDDCLIRYIGLMENQLEKINKKIRNPIIWFQVGFQSIINIPLYVLNWFGILTDNAISSVTTNMFYKLIIGLGGLVTFVSGLVTIIQGKEETIKFIHKILNH